MLSNIRKGNKNILIQLMENNDFRQLDSVTITCDAKFNSNDYEIAQIIGFDISKLKNEDLKSVDFKQLKDIAYNYYIYPDLKKYDN